MDDTDLGKNAADFAPLTPLGFITRSAMVYPETACARQDDRAGLDIGERAPRRALPPGQGCHLEAAVDICGPATMGPAAR